VPEEHSRLLSRGSAKDDLHAGQGKREERTVREGFEKERRVARVGWVLGDGGIESVGCWLCNQKGDKYLLKQPVIVLLRSSNEF
jgi:hypothetical protein